ncbi:MAG: hypothetical protein IJX80_09415 [Clostridia bacterium]|nr:hypothetical protein [Clostridia bacterium]
MSTYLISLIAAAMVAALIGILSPDGERGGIAKHMRFLVSLFLLCVLIAPLRETIGILSDFANGKSESPEIGEIEKQDYQKEMENAMSASSKAYLVQLLTQALEKNFSIESGNVRCSVRWTDADGTLSPTRVTVILSESAIWSDPEPIERFVTELLGCECVTAIE